MPLVYCGSAGATDISQKGYREVGLGTNRSAFLREEYDASS